MDPTDDDRWIHPYSCVLAWSMCPSTNCVELSKTVAMDPTDKYWFHRYNPSDMGALRNPA